MWKKIFVLAAIAIPPIVWGAGNPTHSFAAQDILAPYKNNNCVTCHARLTSPLRLTNHYAQWHMSTHREKEVGCEKCHGGDSGISDAKNAHKGVLPPSDAGSRLHNRNLPETCNACHQGVVSSFVESKHYQNLKSVGLGPSCSTCHAHMASEVIYSAEQVSTLCSSCHNSSNALMPRRPEIPVQAGETMEAIRRSNMMTAWADRLLEEAHKRKMDVADADKEMRIVRAMHSEAKLSWHAFNLEVVRRKADAAYETGNKLKDELRSKLYPQ